MLSHNLRSTSPGCSASLLGKRVAASMSMYTSKHTHSYAACRVYVCVATGGSAGSSLHATARHSRSSRISECISGPLIPADLQSASPDRSASLHEQANIALRITCVCCMRIERICISKCMFVRLLVGRQVEALAPDRHSVVSDPTRQSSSWSSSMRASLHGQRTRLGMRWRRSPG